MGEHLPRLQRLVATAVILAILGPNAIFLAVQYEDWPFTSGPMYAYYIDRDTRRFHVVFVGEFSDGRQRPVQLDEIGVNWVVLRGWLRHVYGACGLAPLYDRFPDDNPAAFVERLRIFHRAFALAFNRRAPHTPLVAIRLQIHELGWERNDDIGSVEVGRYAVATDSFTHTWGAGT